MDWRLKGRCIVVTCLDLHLSRRRDRGRNGFPLGGTCGQKKYQQDHCQNKESEAAGEKQHYQYSFKRSD
jgi:hypothetical protein